MNKITRSERTERGIRYNEPVIPDGYVVVDAYIPSSTITPYDSYGNRRLKRCQDALAGEGIESISLVTRRTIVSPRGSGPGGSVRFGDDMLPGIYKTAVWKADEVRANAVLSEL